MIAAELRGGSKPSLNEALGWIGSRVDDIYGANVGRLEDVWIDPGTGVPRWLLVKEGRFGGRTTLIPFEDATAGAGHVWVPYERDVVRSAPEIEPGAPLTQHVEASLRTHYAANVPSSISHGSAGRPQTGHPVEPANIGRRRGSALGTATVRFQPPPEAGPPEFFSSRGSSAERQTPPIPQRPVIRGPQAVPQDPSAGQPQPTFTPSLPERPAPPIAIPEPPRAWSPPPQAVHPAYGQPEAPPAQSPPMYAQPQATPPYAPPQPAWQPPPQTDPAQGPIDQLRALAESGGSHYVEIELNGELTIRGELRTVRVTPRDPGGPPPG